MTRYMPHALSGLHPDERTMPFWEATRRRELVACRCAECGWNYPLPPVVRCWECGSTASEWSQLGPDAVVYSFTIVRQALMDELAELVPYVVAVVEFAGTPGTRLVTNIVDVDVDEVAVGMPVTVVWDDVGDHTFPRFAPVRRSA